MQSPPKANRILLWSVALAGMAGAVVLFAGRQPPLPPVVQAHTCKSLPPNIEKLGPALAPQEASAAIGSYGQEYAALKASVRPEDTVHEFETAVTGGHLVMRGNCFIGQAVTWIR